MGIKDKNNGGKTGEFTYLYHGLFEAAADTRVMSKTFLRLLRTLENTVERKRQSGGEKREAQIFIRKAFRVMTLNLNRNSSILLEKITLPRSFGIANLPYYSFPPNCATDNEHARAHVFFFLPKIHYFVLKLKTEK